MKPSEALRLAELDRIIKERKETKDVMNVMSKWSDSETYLTYDEQIEYGSLLYAHKQAQVDKDNLYKKDIQENMSERIKLRRTLRRMGYCLPFDSTTEELREKLNELRHS